MIVARPLAIEVSDETSFGNLVRRAAAALRDAGIAGHELRFSLINKPSELGQSSATDKILKFYPTMKLFSVEVPSPLDGTMQKALSNMVGLGEARGARGALMDASLLEEISRGIPDRFPVLTAEVLFDKVTFGGPGLVHECPADLRPPAVMGDMTGYFSSQILVRGGWYMSGTFMASACLLFDGSSSVKVASPVLELLSNIGKVEPLLPVPLLAADEAARLDATHSKIEAEISAFSKKRADWLSSISFPHRLAADRSGTADVSIVELAGATASSFGFRPCANQAAFKKQLVNGAAAIWEFHNGPSGATSSTLSFYCLEGAFTIPLACGPGEAFEQFRATNEEAGKQLIENFAVQVRRLDDELLPKLVAASGSQPKWFVESVEEI